MSKFVTQTGIERLIAIVKSELDGKANASEMHSHSNKAVLDTITDAKVKEQLNIKDFGAVGDGATNCTTAIQNAIDQAYTNGGGIVFIPTGTFLVTSLNMKTNVHLKGNGCYSSIIKTTSDNTSTALISHVSGASDFSITELTVDGGNTYQNKRGILTHGIHLNLNTSGTYANDHYCRIENVHIVGCGNYGIYEQAGRENRFINIMAVNCGINNFRFVGSDNYIENCASANAGEQGFYVQSGNCKMTNCKSWWSGEETASNGHGFHFIYGGTSVISNCEAQENNCDGFRFDTSMCYTAKNLLSDQNNKGEVGGVAYKINQCSEVVIEGIAKNTVTLNGNGHDYALSITGTSFNNTVTLKAYDGAAMPMEWFNYSESVNVSNTITINDYEITYPNLIDHGNEFVDSDGDGILDCFDSNDTFIQNGITHSMTADTTKKAQKISITANTSGNQYFGAELGVMTLDVTAGEKISLYMQAMSSSDSIEAIGLIKYIDSSDGEVSTVQTSVASSANEWKPLYLIDGTIPTNAVKARVYIKARSGISGSPTGDTWFKDVRLTITNKAPKQSTIWKQSVVVTQEQYDALTAPDANTLYLIKEV